MCWNVARCYDSECAKDVGMMPRLINTTLFLQAKFISWLWSRQGFGITTFLRFSCLIQLNPLTLLPMPPIYITHGYSDLQVFAGATKIVVCLVKRCWDIMQAPIHHKITEPFILQQVCGDERSIFHYHQHVKISRKVLECRFFFPT